MMLFKIFKYPIILLIGFFAGINYSNKTISSSNSHSTQTSFNPIIDSGNNENNPISVQILTNPTCITCQEIQSEICSNLARAKIPYQMFFVPMVKIDILISLLLDQLQDEPEKLKAFNWLKNNQNLWAHITEEEQLKKILLEHNVFQENNMQKITADDNQAKSDFILHTIFPLLKIDSLPNIQIKLSLMGNPGWKILNEIVVFLQQKYQQLKIQSKVK